MYPSTTGTSGQYASPSSTRATYPTKTCDESFWFGLHPDDRWMVSRRLGPWSVDERLRDFVEFQKVFDTLVDIFSQHPRDIQWERDFGFPRRDPRRDFISETLEQESRQPVAFTPTTAVAPASSSAATTVPTSPASTAISPLPAVVIDSTSVSPTVVSPALPAAASTSPVSVPASPVIAFLSPAPIVPAVSTSSAVPVTSFTTAIFDSPTVIALAPPASAVPASPAFAIVATSSAPAAVASAATSPIATFPVSAQPAPCALSVACCGHCLSSIYNHHLSLAHRRFSATSHFSPRSLVCHPRLRLIRSHAFSLVCRLVRRHSSLSHASRRLRVRLSLARTRQFSPVRRIASIISRRHRAPSLCHAFSPSRLSLSRRLSFVSLSPPPQSLLSQPPPPRPQSC
ncbi:hypothetical protein F5148DRAFT_96024 [Russula earlei]|uniref:Uncharacterized protein n=1 Tax=Russula earlei TaxID=71964 RepID=A0ACC0UKL2_9AGAM|nr:hypothetical protein F5148DRAFT_96024 [Russula earlei]